MFSLNIYLRWALIALSFGLGIWCVSAYGFWWSLLFFIPGILLLVGYLLLGTVQSSAMMIQQQDFAGAAKRLNMTFWPKLLYKPNRAYYFMIKGNLALADKRTDEAESWMLQANEIGFQSDNERAMIGLQLANIAASRNNLAGAQFHMKKIMDYHITEPQIKEQVDLFKKALAQGGAQRSGMMRQGGGSGMVFQPGGKRRRPRPR